jgi:hypothetical protein
MTGPRISSVENETNNSTIDVICSIEEAAIRLEHCKTCDQFTHSSGFTVCAATQCNISLMTTMKFKMCPKEFWQ